MALGAAQALAGLFGNKKKRPRGQLAPASDAAETPASTATRDGINRVGQIFNVPDLASGLAGLATRRRPGGGGGGSTGY